MAVTASATALIVLTTLSGQARGDDRCRHVQWPLAIVRP